MFSNYRSSLITATKTDYQTLAELKFLLHKRPVVLTFSDVGVTLKLKKKKHSSGFGNWVGPINIEQIQGLFKNVCVTTDIYWYFFLF